MFSEVMKTLTLLSIEDISDGIIIIIIKRCMNLHILTNDWPDGQAVDIQKFLAWEAGRLSFFRFIWRLKYALTI